MFRLWKNECVYKSFKDIKMYKTHVSQDTIFFVLDTFFHTIYLRLVLNE